MEKSVDDKHGEYLMSHVLDEERESIPNAWPESRTTLMDRLEKKALDYGIEHIDDMMNPSFVLNRSYSRTASQNSPAKIVEQTIHSRISKRLALHGK